MIAALNNNMYYEYDAADQRRDATVTLHLWNPATSSYYDFDRLRYRKYIDTLYMANFANPYESGQNTSSSVLRYADVLLIKAEALNELNAAPTAAAYDALNAIRRRAFKSVADGTVNAPADGSAIDLSGLTKEQFRQAVRDERDWSRTGAIRARPAAIPMLHEDGNKGNR